MFTLMDVGDDNQRANALRFIASGVQMLNDPRFRGFRDDIWEIIEDTESAIREYDQTKVLASLRDELVKLLSQEGCEADPKYTRLMMEVVGELVERGYTNGKH